MDYREKVALSEISLVNNKRIEVSQTYLNKGNECVGQQFYHVLATMGLLTAPKENIWPGTIFGTAFHRLMEDIVPMRITENSSTRQLQLYAREKILLYYEQDRQKRASNPNYELKEPTSETSFKSDQVPTIGVEATTNFIPVFIDTYLKDKSDYPESFVSEMEIGVEWDDLIYLRGTIDLVFKYVDRSRLLDFKTSKVPEKFVKTTKGEFEDPQSGVYSYLYHSKTSNECESFDYLILNVPARKVIIHEYPGYNTLRVDNLRTRIQGFRKLIESQDRKKFFIFNRRVCKFCVYRDVCPVYHFRNTE